MSIEAQGLRSSSMRQRNLSTVMRMLHHNGALSRSDLGQRTGLTRAAVATLVGDLVQLGLAVEAAPERTTARGRPSSVVHPLTDRNVVIGIDLMVDSIGVALVGIGGQVLLAERRARPRHRMTPQASLDVAATMVDELIAHLDADVRVFGIGVAVPGLVVSSDSRVALAPNLGWRDVDLVRLVESTIGRGRLVVVGNEADMGAVAENRRGSGRSRRNLLYLSGEVGVGGGIIVDHELVSGHNGFAGEIGHIPLNPGGVRCSCGAIGCFETELGEAALVRRAKLSGDGRAAIDQLIELAEAGDEAALAALAEHARWLALGLSGPLNLLDLEVVVCGGLFGRIYPFIEAPLMNELASRALIAERTTPVVASELGDIAPLVGAAELTFDRVFADLEVAVAET